MKAATYILKYVYKGGDRAMMRVEAGQGTQVARNEVDEYEWAL